MKKDTLIIPDIHGRINVLNDLLETYDPSEYDFIFLGDFCDRGLDTKEVMLKVLGLVLDGHAQICYGNHELMMLDAIVNPEVFMENWLFNGGWATMGSFKDNADMSATLATVLKHAQHYIIKDDILYAHAAPPLILGEKVFGQYHVWNRPSQPMFNLPEGCNMSVHGHTIMSEPYVDEEVAYIDLGLSKLAVFSHNQRKVIEVIDSYDKIHTMAETSLHWLVKNKRVHTLYEQRDFHEACYNDNHDARVNKELDERLEYLLSKE